MVSRLRSPQIRHTPLEISPFPILYSVAYAHIPGRLSSNFTSGPHTSIPSPTTKAAEGVTSYALVTDQIFLQVPSVVWESIEYIDGTTPNFVGGAVRRFVKSYITVKYLLTG